jgi:hypothetical protein
MGLDLNYQLYRLLDDHIIFFGCVLMIFSVLFLKINKKLEKGLWYTYE